MRAFLILALAGGLSAADLVAAQTLSGGTLYNDQVARQVGDLVTILVKETTSVSDTAKTETKRQNDAQASVNVLPNSARLPAAQGQDNSGTLPAFDLGSRKEFKGEGKVEASGEVRATITGRVTDILDNGNLVVEGVRQIKVNADTKTIRITGVIRAVDIRPDNTVLSEKLHNFQVAIDGEGPLTRAQQEGWLGRMIDTVWPF
jgi:flagellar L-ring protein precursor FlgH